MKNNLKFLRLVPAIFAILTVMQAHANPMNLSILGGANVSQAKASVGGAISTSSALLGFTGGAALEYKVFSWAGIEAGASYLRRNFAVDDSTFISNWLAVPVVLKLHLANFAYLGAGITWQQSYGKVASEINAVKKDYTITELGYKETGLSFTGVAGFSFNFSSALKMRAELRYMQSKDDISTQSDITRTFVDYQALLGFIYPLSK